VLHGTLRRLLLLLLLLLRLLLLLLLLPLLDGALLDGTLLDGALRDGTLLDGVLLWRPPTWGVDVGNWRQPQTGSLCDNLLAAVKVRHEASALRVPSQLPEQAL
jgi:hypothetical protein